MVTDDVAAMHEFMASWNNELIESGEFVDARGLAAPVHTRRIKGLENGVPVVTDGPHRDPGGPRKDTRSSNATVSTGRPRSRRE